MIESGLPGALAVALLFFLAATGKSALGIALAVGTVTALLQPLSGSFRFEKLRFLQSGKL